ncbi:MAG: hypothetical protein C5B50_29750 [Verrucomicrobia bacterium]|nr:MAG: hypothetical protein C5B50_29750 [Verrucomicrobiota bacterium]
MPKKPNRSSKPALELIEEAFHLLRSAPAGVLAIYYAGALPFVLTLLYFWTDMSRSADAHQRLAGASLGLAALFLWMKLCQSLFSMRLRGLISIEPPEPTQLRLCARILLSETALQPTGLFLISLASIPILPLAWVYAFYQNLTILAGQRSRPAQRDEQAAGNRSSTLWPLMKEARRQAALWPAQNNTVLGVLTLFGLCIFLNWMTVCLLLPGALKTLFGIESVFSRSTFSMLNSTFFAVNFSLTWLCVDPLIKAIYTLRCFYGQSLESGEDLKAELRAEVTAVQSPKSKVQSRSALAASLRQIASGMIWAAALSGIAATPTSPARISISNAQCSMLSAQLLFASAAFPEQPAPSGTSARSDEPPAALSPGELDKSIQKVIEQRKYAWRAPRDRTAKTQDSDKSWFGRFFEQVAEWLGDRVKAFGQWLGRILEKIFGNRRTMTTSSGFGIQWTLILRILLVALVAAALGALLVLIYRTWNNRRHKANASALTTPEIAPDITDDNVGAEQLPEDGWLTLARELLGRGELRLALRAFYFASLVRLAERNLITLARFKSNRDYERELRRRGHSFPELLAGFGENVAVFERIWYGMHELDTDMVRRFVQNVEHSASASGQS